jgi:hypothetical protein
MDPDDSCVGYHTEHFFSGFILEPRGQPYARANSLHRQNIPVRKPLEKIQRHSINVEMPKKKKAERKPKANKRTSIMLGR